MSDKSCETLIKSKDLYSQELKCGSTVEACCWVRNANPADYQKYYTGISNDTDGNSFKVMSLHSPVLQCFSGGGLDTAGCIGAKDWGPDNHKPDFIPGGEKPGSVSGGPNKTISGQRNAACQNLGNDVGSWREIQLRHDVKQAHNLIRGGSVEVVLNESPEHWSSGNLKTELKRCADDPECVALSYHPRDWIFWARAGHNGPNGLRWVPRGGSAQWGDDRPDTRYENYAGWRHYAMCGGERDDMNGCDGVIDCAFSALFDGASDQEVSVMSKALYKETGRGNLRT